MTLQDCVQQARLLLTEAGCDTPALDAELLAAKVLHIDRSRLWLEPDRPLSEPEQQQFRQFVERRRRREPLPYILGKWEFFGLPLEVSPAVLIPRPETETLVEACLERLKSFSVRPRGSSAPRSTQNSELSTLNSEPSAPSTMLLGAEAGCGTGAISLALAHSLPDIRIFATDCSEAALALAQRNVHCHALQDRITLLHGDLLEPVGAALCGCPSASLGSAPGRPHRVAPTGYGALPSQVLDFVVANLPYIATNEIPSLPPEVRDWEPREALDGGPDGLAVIRRLIAEAPRWLKPDGFLALEISPEQAAPVKELLIRRGFTRIEIIADLSGRERVAIAHLAADARE